MDNQHYKKNLSELTARGRGFLQCEIPIMGGAMSWISDRNLVAAVSNAGGFGVIACGSMSPELLDQEIKATQAMTNKPFGVNLIIMHPKLEELIEICLHNNVKYIVLAGSVPSGNMIAKAKQHGTKVLCFAPTLAIAKRLIRNGCDALMIEGMEAGGHIGPVSTFVLAQEILPVLAQELPIFVAGGIGRGEAILSFLKMGAAGCQIGTLLVCATESIAHPKFKQAFIRANARDAIPSVQLDEEFIVTPVRALENEATIEFMRVQRSVIQKYKDGKIDKPEAQLEIEHFWAGALRRAVIEGDIDKGSLMAGQSVGMVNKEQPAKDILEALMSQAAELL